MKRIVGADRKVGIATEFVDGEHDTEEEVSHCYKCKAGRVTLGGTLINIHRPQWGWNAFSSPNSRAGGEQRRRDPQSNSGVARRSIGCELTSSASRRSVL